jgi:precorrin-4 methylase
VLPHVFDADPATVKACLVSGNSDVYHTACEQLYRNVEVEVSIAGAPGLSPMDTTAAALDCCPARAHKAKLLALLRCIKEDENHGAH